MSNQRINRRTILRRMLILSAVPFVGFAHHRPKHEKGGKKKSPKEPLPPPGPEWIEAEIVRSRDGSEFIQVYWAKAVA